MPLEVLQGVDLNFAVKVTDIADDCAIFHRAHVVNGDDVDVACGGDENVATGGCIFHRRDFIAFHRGLKRADRIDFGDDDARTSVAERCGRTFAHVAKASDDADLARHHHVCRATDAVDE